MSPITLRLDLPREARCPICQHDLLGPLVAFYLGFAFCQPCLSGCPRPILRKVLTHFAYLPNRASWSVVRGLNFYTPPRFARRDAATFLQDDLPLIQPGSDGPVSAIDLAPTGV